MPMSVATGGDGKYPKIIDWIDWGAKANQIVLRDETSRKSVTSTSTAGDKTFEVTCTIDKLDWDHPMKGVNQDEPEPIKKPPLTAYIPGTWAGDALDNLYNIGGKGYFTHLSNPQFRNDYRIPNTMAIGLGNPQHQFPDVYDESGAPLDPRLGDELLFGVRMSFDFTCAAELVNPQDPADSTPVPLEGLVFADAEASNGALPVSSEHPEGRRAEWVQAKARVPTGAPAATWRLLERARSCTTAHTKAQFFPDNDLRLLGMSEECIQVSAQDPVTQQSTVSNPEGYGPSVVAFMQGATSARVELQGGGSSAVALGYVLSTDYGDAPASYGEAGAVLQPNWSGGVIGEGDLWDEDQEEADYELGKRLVLGDKVDPETSYGPSTLADGDDTSGENDEDGLVGSSLASKVLPISAFNGGDADPIVTQVRCYGRATEPGYVAAWIDWNVDGVFQKEPFHHADSPTGERSTGATTCPPGGPHTVNLSWTVPAGTNPKTTHTFARFRIAADQAEAESPTGMSVSGEVEDHRLRLPAQVILEPLYVVNGLPSIGTDPLPSWLDPVSKHPRWLTAEPTPHLSADQAPSVQWWGWEQGYRSGDNVTIGQTPVSIDATKAPGCTLTETRLVDGNDPRTWDLAKGENTQGVTLQRPLNKFQLRNVIDCKQTLTLVKQVSSGTASPSEWTLGASGPTGSLTWGTGVTGTQRHVTDGVPYTLSESGGPANYVPDGTWACVDHNGASVPVQDVDGEPGVIVPFAANVTCAHKSTTGKLVLLKHVDGGSVMTPGQFALTATPVPSIPGLGAVTVPAGADLTPGVDDLVAATIEVLPETDYTITESSTTAFPWNELRIERWAGSAWVPHGGATVQVSTGQTGIYRFVNAEIPRLQLPMAGGGGRGAGAFLGSVVLAAVGAAAAIRRLREAGEK